MSKQLTRKTLQTHNLAPSKRFGQNFLVNPNTAQSIVTCANIAEEDIIIEVGVGLGALSVPLAQRAREVIGVEIDRGLIRYHTEENLLPDNVCLIHEDILKVDFQKLRNRCGKKLIIVANLPYSISNPFIFKLIDMRQHIDRVVVMLQKEVADRLKASPSTKEYGIPTVLLNACASIETKMILKPHEFHPQPKIHSSVISIQFELQSRASLMGGELFSLFQKVVRASFAQRRKMLLNNLAQAPFLVQGDTQGDLKGKMSQIIVNTGLKPNIRAEQLTVDDFARLSEQIARMLKASKKIESR